MTKTLEDTIDEEHFSTGCWVDTVCGTGPFCGKDQYDSSLNEPKNYPTVHIDELDDLVSNDNDPTDESDLSNSNRRIWVVTTAALPWMTGTAMNPLVRALFLTQNRPKGFVTLVIPWLNDRTHRMKLYGEKYSFSDGAKGMKEQEEYIKNYACERCDAIEESKKLNILFYPSTYNEGFGSIFPTSDICSLIPDSEADVAILEEPEHLNWFRIPSKLHAENISETKEEDSKTKLGWAHKFCHVVGIIHTNYAAYARQNGYSTAVVGAPTLNIASALVVRAYCHKIIKLSPVLPDFAPGKETTENVHGVRNEFLAPASKTNGTEEESQSFADVYFIGKILWAKGFDIMVRVQDRYRRVTGNFFPIDVYGSGPDEKPIIRAFHGRVDKDGGVSPRPSSPVRFSNPDKKLDEIFSNPSSLRSQSYDSLASQDSVEIASSFHNKCFSFDQDDNDPLSILYDIKEKSVDTGIKTTKAVYHLADSAIQRGLAMTFSMEHTPNNNSERKKNLVFDPPQSRFELRRHPIPANFLGRKDHALLRGLPYKVFFNPSISEVLCTTTAEALAMGFFVIIPEHPSNEFFYQFSNCLTYSNEAECVERLIWALKKENNPTPLSEEEAYVFTWKAATDRLIKASMVTKGEAKYRIESGMAKTDERIAWLHSKSGTTGGVVRKYFVKEEIQEGTIEDDNSIEKK